MAKMQNVCFAALTRNQDDAGSENLLNLTINIDGSDVVDSNIAWKLQQGEPAGFRKTFSLSASVTAVGCRWRSRPKCTLGWLSADPQEGKQSVVLPLRRNV